MGDGWNSWPDSGDQRFEYVIDGRVDCGGHSKCKGEFGRGR